MTANMYRVGDYVYFETSPNQPYQIRRIEELNKTPNGNVEAKVMCFFRRRDLPSSLIMLADKHQSALELDCSDESPSSGGDVSNGNGTDNVNTTGNGHNKELSNKQKHQLKQRELFLSRQVETLPATHIRGKCSVTLLNETESLLSYLNKEDSFFYCLVFDPAQKTLLADKGEIRVGSKYQSDITPYQGEATKDPKCRESKDFETLVWTPGHSLTDKQIDQFLVISRSVGTFARALDCSSSVKQPSLHMSAAAASRDITLFHAMDTLDKHKYSLADAISSLVPSTGPVLCRDEMEEWSASEANLFEEALEKYGKDFNDIRTDFLPWKTLKNIIEYYYMWKTTDRYVQQKRVKAVEAESKLKQVYIPNYNKPPAGATPGAISNNNKLPSGTGMMNGANGDVLISSKPCESCNVTVSTNWFPWYSGTKICVNCHAFWRKYGGLKIPGKISDGELEYVKCGSKKSGGSSLSEEDRIGPSGLAGHRPHRCSVPGCTKEFKLKVHLHRHLATGHGLAPRPGSPRPIMKTRNAFYLRATPLTRISRRLCRHVIQPRHAARSPFWCINIAAVKTECQIQMASKSPYELKDLLRYIKKERGSVTAIATRLAKVRGHPLIVPEFLNRTPAELRPPPLRVAFPKPPKAPDGSLLYERIPNKPDLLSERVPGPGSPSPGSLPPAAGASIVSIAAVSNAATASMLLKRRAFDELNGLDVIPHQGPPTKRIHKEAPPISPMDVDHATVPIPPGVIPPPVMNLLNGGPGAGVRVPVTPKRITPLSARTGRKQVISWMDAPDDLYFRSTDLSKRARKQLTVTELRKAARKPWRRLIGKIYPNTDAPLLSHRTIVSSNKIPS
uniref:Metastasis-associated protein MTA1 n=1 Tax=Cacopsylla melanoneura TaxID=428564 RepID=A0A8D8ZSH4_9HEMI